MDSSNGSSDGPPEPIFSARLSPHRSLGARGFALLMGLVGLTCFLAGLLFWRLGAWPVVGFLGLDWLLIWLAFRLNYRAARAHEDVVMTRDELLIRKVAASGRASEVRFNPYFARLEVTRVEDEGVTALAVRVSGQKVTLGAFLNPEDRESFARAFGAALAEARAPGT
jgi:uncharacterized membrane protein